MLEAFVNINQVPTHVMAWGKWIEESFEKEEEIIICITGNPGVTSFYTKFLSTLYDSLDQNTSIWALGHAGHCETPRTSTKPVPQLEGNENRYDLGAQIQHKIDFIRKYVPEHMKIRLIGHSIGAYVILEMLKNPDIKNRINKAYFLFPTLERMKESPNGKLFTRLVVPLWFIISFIVLAFNMLPVMVRTYIIAAYFWIFGQSQECIPSALDYTKFSVMEKVVFLAKDEMQKVAELNIHAIKSNVNLLKLYYGTTDGWVPVEYFHQIKQRIPNIDAILCDKQIPHAFVLKRSSQMATIVAGWISQERQILNL